MMNGVIGLLGTQVINATGLNKYMNRELNVILIALVLVGIGLAVFFSVSVWLITNIGAFDEPTSITLS